jgi:hypothetical protein
MAFSTDVYDIMTLEEEYLIPKEERGVHEDSYECFRRLKDEGKLPMPNRSVLSRRFTEAESRQWIAPSLPSPATPETDCQDLAERYREALVKAEAFLDENYYRLAMSGREAAALATIRIALQQGKGE